APLRGLHRGPRHLGDLLWAARRRGLSRDLSVPRSRENVLFLIIESGFWLRRRHRNEGEESMAVRSNRDSRVRAGDRKVWPWSDGLRCRSATIRSRIGARLFPRDPGSRGVAASTATPVVPP